MKTYRCCFQECLAIPKWMCACSNPPLLICENHLGRHGLTQASLSCKIITIELKPVDAESKSKFIQHVKLQQTFIKQTKNELIVRASHISDLLNSVLIKSLKEINELEKQCSLLLKEAIDVEDKCSPYTEIGSILSKHPEEINNLLPTFNFSDILNPVNGIISNLEQYITTHSIAIDSQIPQSQKIISTPLDQILPINSPSHQIIPSIETPQEISLSPNSLFFYHPTYNKIIEIETTTNSSNNDTISLESEMSIGISMCKLPNNTIFCYGDMDDNRKGSTFIIESKSRITHLQNGWPCKWASLAYLHKNIYAFGGLDGGSKLNTYRRFDTVTQRWNLGGEMPYYTSNSSAATFQEKIYVIDYTSGHLYLFDPERSNFSREQTFKAQAFKLLFSNNENLFVIESGGNIYMSQSNSKKLVKVFGSQPNLFADRLASFVLAIDNVIYYVALQSQASEYILYKFDMKRRVNSLEKEWL